jgi:hypothetical protein
METPVKYDALANPLGQVDSPIYPEDKRRRVLESAYFQAIANTLNSLLLGYKSFSSDEEVIERAIAITDKLIEKVGGGCESEERRALYPVGKVKSKN